MDIFFPKIILLDLGYCPPQTDILTYSKGGYGGEGGWPPMPEGGVTHPFYQQVIPTPPVVGVDKKHPLLTGCP